MHNTPSVSNDNHIAVPGTALKLGRRAVRCLPLGRRTAARLVTQVLGPKCQAVISNCPGSEASIVLRLNEFIDAQLFYNGVFEPAVTSLIAAWLGDGHTFCDVGANSGYYSLLAWSRVKPHGRVISFEPDPNSLQRLQQNLLRNPEINIEVVPYALADRNDVSAFWGSSPRQGNQGGGTLCEGEGTPLIVRTMTLDTFMETSGVSSIDLLKMDIEGSEALALYGMHECLRRRSLKHLLVEVHRDPLKKFGQSPRDVIEYLRSAGYRGVRVVERKRHGYRKYQANGYLLKPIEAADTSAPLAHYLFSAGYSEE